MAGNETPILTAGGKTAEIFFPRQPISAAQEFPRYQSPLQQQAAGLHHVVTYLAVGLLRMFVAISAMLDGAEDFSTAAVLISVPASSAATFG